MNNSIEKLFSRSRPSTTLRQSTTDNADENNFQRMALSTILGGLKLNTNLTQYRITPTPYDVIIRINSLKDLGARGWEILLGEHTKKMAPSKINTSTDNDAAARTSPGVKEGVVVTVLGAYNRGKSFLLNNLCRVKLPNGNLIHTEGISITAGKENYTNIVFLDTAGTDTPVKNEDIEFKRATEALLREVVLHLCTFIVVVVNRLRATDQIYIREVLKYCQTVKNNTSMVIVHNLLDIETIHDLEQAVKNEVKRIFGAIENQIQLPNNGTYRTVKFFTSKQGKIELRHFILAKTGSEAAKIWNSQSFDGLMNIFQNTDNKRSLDIINDMIDYVNTRMPQLFVSNTDTGLYTPPQNVQIQQHDKQPYIVLSSRRDREDLLDEPHNLELSEKLAYDDAGYFIRHESGNWQPRYNLYEDDNKIYLVVELPGFKKGECEINLLENSISIEGNRGELNENMTNPVIRQSDIPTGPFKLQIPFPSKVETEEIESERVDGFIKITATKKRVSRRAIVV